MPATRACSSSGSPSPTSVTLVPGGCSRSSWIADRVHRDRPDDRAALAVDEHLGPAEVAPETIGVADREDSDPGVGGGDEAASVARRLARPQQLRLCDLGPPREHRLEAVGRRILAERRQPVERDPAARGVEPRFGKSQRRCAVRCVPRQPRERRRRLARSARSARGRTLDRSRQSPGASSTRPRRASVNGARRAPTVPSPCRA